MRFPSPDALQLSQSFPLVIRPMHHLALALVCLLAGVLSAGDALERGFVLKRKADQSCIALVVGNAAYPDQPLKNPVNDADDTAAALERLGFIVTKVVNADRVKFQQAVEQFGKQIIGKQAAAFYYAGHGLQVAGENYLLPLGEVLNNEAEVPYKAINAGLVLAQMEAAKCPINLVVLDACRDNPLARFGRSTVKGLAQVHGPAGSVIVYATAPGQIASDGGDRNGIFTGAFLKHLATPGQDIDLFLRVVSGEVQQASGGRQIPWRSSNLTQGFTFVPAPTAADLEVERKARGELLGTLEVQQAELDRQRKTEEAQILAKQGEIADLEAKIKAAQAKMNAAGTESAGGDFEAIVAMAEAKERQAAELAEMRRMSQESRKKMEKETALLAEAEYAKRFSALDVDIHRFLKLAESLRDTAMRDQAWAALLKKWTITGIPTGDTAEMRKRIFPGHDSAISAATKAFAVGTRQALEDFVAKYSPHIGVIEARSMLNWFPAWASSVGVDSSGKWAKLQIGSETQIMRLIPAGNFQRKVMRLTPGFYGGKYQEVDQKASMSSFWLADCEVTVLIWNQMIERKNSQPNDKHEDITDFFRLREKFGDKIDFRPVSRIDWDETQEFLRNLNKSVPTLKATLPTVAQWEYACYAGTNGNFADMINDIAWYEKNSDSEPHPVKQKKANAWGIFDMHGNVAEWCFDLSESFIKDSTQSNLSEIRDPIGTTTGGLHSTRGSDARSSRTSDGNLPIENLSPGFRGFRIAAPVVTEPSP